MTEAFDISTLTPEAIRSMSPDEAGEALRQFEIRAKGPSPLAQPATAQNAQACLDALSKDHSFYKRLRSGDTAAVKQFQELAELAGGNGSDYISTTIDGAPSRRMVAAATDGLLQA